MPCRLDSVAWRARAVSLPAAGIEPRPSHLTPSMCPSRQVSSQGTLILTSLDAAPAHGAPAAPVRQSRLDTPTARAAIKPGRLKRGSDGAGLCCLGCVSMGSRHASRSGACLDLSAFRTPPPPGQGVRLASRDCLVFECTRLLVSAVSGRIHGVSDVTALACTCPLSLRAGSLAPGGDRARVTSAWVTGRGVRGRSAAHSVGEAGGRPASRAVPHRGQGWPAVA